jgi:hypothetical protein
MKPKIEKLKEMVNNWRQINKNNAKLQATTMQMLLHPECTDAQALEVVHLMRRVNQTNRKTRDELLAALPKFGTVFQMWQFERILREELR